jgi:WD40 repeat protein
MPGTTDKCPQCARPIAASAPRGLCPACLISSLLEPVDGATDDALEMPAPVAARERIGDYELLDEIGRGGMGLVFRARDLRLNRVVALKLILTGRLASEAEVKRFRAEAEAAAHLEHPNIVPIYEVGESEGRHFFAMKFMEGGSLARRCEVRGERDERNDRLSPHTSALLLLKIARAIHHAHERGILHRDLKPGNILLDANGEPAVTDFGLARRIGGDSELTLSGAAVGSPSYMAPEQASGRSREVTIAADVYSLGAVLFHLLTGRAPFAEDSAVATLRAVVEREPSRPSTLNHGIDRDLDTICLKCLAKAPARRYATAAELADDLERWQGGKPVFARPTGPGERALKWVRRHPAWAALIGFGVVALAAFIGMQSFNEANLRREKEFAQKQEGAARASEAAMRLNLYASDMFLAARALEQGNLALARRTLAAHIPREGEEDLRGFEWRHYWHQAQGQQERVLGGFSNAVNCVAFSSDGRWLAAGGGNLVQKWNATNGALVAAWRHSPGPVVNSLAFSPDGSSIWAGESKGQIRVWLDGLARPIGEITRGTGYVHIAVPAGAVGTLAIGERNGTEGGAHGAVALYSFIDLLARNERGNLLPNSGGLAAFSRDGQYLLTGGGSDHVLRHNLKSGESIPVPGWIGLLIALAISPDGERAAVSTSNGYGLGLFDFRPGAVSQTAVSLAWRCRALAFSPDGETLAAASFDHTVRLLRMSFGLQTHRFDGHTDQVLAVAFSPDGRTLASASKDGTVRVWDLTTVSRDEVPGIFTPFALSPDGRTIHAGNVDDWRSTVLRRDLTDTNRPPEPMLRLRPERFPDLVRQHAGLLRWKFEGGATPQQWAKLEQFVGRDTNRVIWRSGPEGKPNAKDRIADRVKGVSASAADGSVLAMADKSKVRLWHNFTSTRLPDLQPAPHEVRQMALSDEGRLLAVSATTSNVVSVWDTATGTNLFRLPPRPSSVRELLFSPDGRTVAVAGEDATVDLRDSRTGELRATLAGHDVGLETVAFSPDGRTLATLAGDWLKLWHLPTLREVGSLPLGANFLAFSRDGSLLIATAWNGHVRILRAPRPK